MLRKMCFFFITKKVINNNITELNLIKEKKTGEDLYNYSKKKKAHSYAT